VEQVQDVAHDVRGRQRLAHVAALLAAEVVERQLHEQDRRGVARGVELRQPGAADEVGEDEERDLVLGEDEVHGQLRRAEGRGVQRRLRPARGDVDEVLEDEAAVEHQHLDEVLGGDVVHVLGGVHGAGLPLARGDEADVALDDAEVARRVRVAAGDEAVEVGHLEAVARAEAALGVLGVERADGDEPRRVGVRVADADVARDAGHAVGAHHDPVLLRGRRILLLLRQAARQPLHVHRDVVAGPGRHGRRCLVS